MIVSPFSFVEVQMESMFGQAFKLCKAHFCQSPEPFYTIDMHAASREFILGMVVAIMSVAEVHRPVVTAPSIRVYYRRRIDPTANNTLQVWL